MQSKEGRPHCYVVNHMDEFLFEWSLSEYLQIDSYLSQLPLASFYLTNYQTIANYKSNSMKNTALNAKNVELLEKEAKRLKTLDKDVSLLLKTSLQPSGKDTNSLETSEKYPIDPSKVCLLDMRADKLLSPVDGLSFSYFLFGGILGDHPPRDRTSQLRNSGFIMRSLGALQMSTDTAVLVTSLIIDRGRRYEDIAFIDEPELKGRRKGESVQIEGFRYVDRAYRLEDGGVEEGDRGKEPRMHEKIRKELLFRELDLDDFR